MVPKALHISQASSLIASVRTRAPRRGVKMRLRFRPTRQLVFYYPLRWQRECTITTFPPLFTKLLPSNPALINL